MNSEIAIPEEVRKRYLERRQRDVESLRKDLEQRKLDEFKRIGHQLKGNAASFGYADLERLAVDLEAAAVDHDFKAALHQLELFEVWVQQTSRDQAPT